MFTTEQDSGIFTFLVGMIVLVMVGVGLSIVIDKRLKFSSTQGELQTHIKAETSDLRDLQYDHETMTARLAERGNAHQDSGKLLSELVTESSGLEQRKSSLLSRREELKGEIASTQQKFKKYRDDYRSKAWSKAIGEKLGDLRISGGREYRDCTITKVTDIGLEIRHENGFARIQAPDLDGKLRERFQWNEEERGRLLDSESKLHEEISKNATEDRENSDKDDAPRPTLRVVRADSRDRADQRLRVSELRQQVVAWRSKVSRIKSDKAEASSRAQSRYSASIPGKLETWKTRSARLSVDLAKARAEFEIAKTKLRAIAPGDEALVDPSGDID